MVSHIQEMCIRDRIYVEFTLSACFESFIRCHQHAFEFFGGIPKEIWYEMCIRDRILRMTDDDLAASRIELANLGLIDYQPPYWRVLTLTYPSRSQETGVVGVLVNQTLKRMENR